MPLRLAKLALAAAVLVAILIAAPSAEAQRHRKYNNCSQRVGQAELNLQRAIQRHGNHSKQAEQRRRQLRNIEQRCGAI